MSDNLSNAVKTGSVQVKYVDGTEHTLPLHGITQLQFLRVLDEIGVKNFEELTGPESIQLIRFITRTAALALSFEKNGDNWTVERITQSFADMEQISNIAMKCLTLSTFTQAFKTDKQSKKTGQYQ